MVIPLLRQCVSGFAGRSISNLLELLLLWVVYTDVLCSGPAFGPVPVQNPSRIYTCNLNYFSHLRTGLQAFILI